MSRNIKLIWDFRGAVAENTAKHHEIHLRDYIISQKLPTKITGIETHTELHATAFMVVEEDEMLFFRDALRPHRAEVY